VLQVAQVTEHPAVQPPQAVPLQVPETHDAEASEHPAFTPFLHLLTTIQLEEICVTEFRQKDLSLHAGALSSTLSRGTPHVCNGDSSTGEFLPLDDLHFIFVENSI
jgi:hypothetical protein